MKKISVYLLLVMIMSLLVGSGFSAIFKDVEIANDQVQAGTLELDIEEIGWLDGKNTFAPGESGLFTFQVSNPSSLPYEFQVQVSVDGCLGSMIHIIVPNNGHLNPGDGEILSIPVSMSEQGNIFSEGKSASMQITVKASQYGLPDGFMDEKNLSSPVHSYAEVPQVAIISPSYGQELSGVVVVQAEAYDNFGIQQVLLHLGDEYDMLGIEGGKYQTSINTDELENGSYLLTVEARDGAGLAAQDTIEVKINNPD